MDINIDRLPKDILDKVCSDFEKAQQDAAVDMLLDLNKAVINPRILRCVIYLAKGSIEGLEHCCESAKIDYRDVIYWAEYDSSEIRVRNFDMPFSYSDFYRECGGENGQKRKV